MSFKPPPHDIEDPDLPGMSLLTWMYLNNMKGPDLAKLIPCSRSYPDLIANGIQQPSYKMAVRVEEITEGAVPRTRWYPAGQSKPMDREKALDDDIKL